MTFRLPVFNLRANVWHGALPPDITGGLSLPPASGPDLVPVCQLYLSKYGPGGWFHGWPDDIRVCLERAGYITLRVPLDTDIRCPRWPYHGVTWHDLDLVECPPGSRRWYVIVMVEQAHMGFPNEYRVGIMAQIGPYPFPGDAGGGGGADATASTDADGDAGGGGGASGMVGVGLVGDAGGGGGADGDAVPGSAILGDAGGGGGADGLAVPGGQLVGDAGGGGGADGDAVPGSAILGDAGGGGGADGDAEPGSALKGDAGGGGGADATETHGNTGPAATCLSAATSALPITWTGNIAAGAQQWWKFAGTGGTIYHIQITVNSGSVGSGELDTGNCSGLSPQCTTSGPFWTRQHFTLAVTGDVFVLVSGDLISAGNYTLDVGTGV